MHVSKMLLACAFFPFRMPRPGDIAISVVKWKGRYPCRPNYSLPALRNALLGRHRIVPCGHLWTRDHGVYAWTNEYKQMCMCRGRRARTTVTAPVRVRHRNGTEDPKKM